MFFYSKHLTSSLRNEGLILILINNKCNYKSLSINSISLNSKKLNKNLIIFRYFNPLTNPNLLCLVNFSVKFFVLGPRNPNLLCLVNFSVKFFVLGPRTPTCSAWWISQWNSLCWGPEPQLALPGEFLSEILCVGARTPTCSVWWISQWNSLC